MAQRLRSSSVVITTKTKAPQTSAATKRAGDHRRRLRSGRADWLWRTSWIVGVMPNSRPLTNANPKPYSSNRESSETSVSIPESEMVSVVRSESASLATTSPAAPPKAPINRLSRSSWRTICAGVAPSAIRIAISRRRLDERASSSPAIFAQPVSRTIDAAPHSNSNGRRRSPAM